MPFKRLKEDSGESPKRAHTKAVQRASVDSDYSTAGLASLQRMAGNRAVHELIGHPVIQRAPAPVATADAGQKADPAADAKSLMSEELKTNKDYAGWVLKAHDQGFATFTGKNTEDNLKNLKDGKKIGDIDPNQIDILGSLTILHEVVKGPISRWVADPTKDKQPVEIGSLIRTEESPHGKGAAVDITQGDFTGNANDVIVVLGDLETASYGIGLPFQDDFFPADLKLETLKADEAKKENPGPVTGGLRKFHTHIYTATYDKNTKKWTETIEKEGAAYTLLKSEDLKKQLKKMRDAGSTLMVFPDNDNHLHVDSR